MHPQYQLQSRHWITAYLLAGICLTARAQMPPGNPEGPSVDATTQLASAKARLDTRPNAQGLQQIVRTLQGQAGLTPELKTAAAGLVQEAAELQRIGRNAEARRPLSHAASLLQGGSWNAGAEFAASLVLRPSAPIADSRLPLVVQLAQSYVAVYKPESRLLLKLSLMRASQAHALGEYDLVPGDFNDNPFRLALQLPLVADGSYTLIAEVFDGAKPLGKVIAPMVLLHDIEIRRADVERSLARIRGHEDTQASVRYPYQLIRSTVAGTREAPGYDYAEGLQRSADLLAALQAGRDLLLHAKGDQRRHYDFADAGEIMPYRLYVPTAWKPTVRLPLVVSLHDGGLDENSTLDRGNGQLQRLAEQYGAIVVAPLGYAPSAGYGEPFPVPVALQATPFGFTPPFPTSLRTYQLSEKDVLNVIDRVIAEYRVDISRIYMLGNSAGGGGTWILAARFPERFAAAAPCASSMDIRGLPFERLRTVPLLVCVGEFDVDTRRAVAHYGVDKTSEAGGDARYLLVPGGTHSSGVEIAMPQIFDFFFRHRKDL